MSPRSPSLSEGEVVSGDEEKAISTTTNGARNSKVNTSARLHTGSSSRPPHRCGVEGLMSDPNYHFRDADGPASRSRSRSPYRRDRSRSRSPYRADKPLSGDKRRHEDDHYNRTAASDPRRFKVHYEGRPSSRDSGPPTRRPYMDLDRPEQPKGSLAYDDRSSTRQEPAAIPRRDQGRARDRSRSPFRHTAAEATPLSRDDSHEEIGGRGTMMSRPQPVAGKKKLQSMHRAVVNESESTPRLSQGQDDAKLRFSLSQQSRTKGDSGTTKGREQRKLAAEQAEPEAKVELSEAELIEQRRKKREAIKARHKTNPPLLVQALEHATPSAPPTPFHDSSEATPEQHSPPSSIDSPRTPHRDSPPDSPAEFTVTNDEELLDMRNGNDVVKDEEGPSSADYDPNLDMEEDRPDHKRQEVQEQSTNGTIGAIQVQAQEGVPKQSKEFDMFADDDDMFAAEDSEIKPSIGSTKQAIALDQSLLDNWDYPDGHYRINLGELLDGRYAVQQQIGKGTFATVVRAQDTRTGNSVAIKIAANNETMYKAGTKEMDMLNLLNQNDAEDKKHIIRMLRQFDHKGHMCLVFENLSADLREVLKKFGRNVGLNLKAIRSYAQQMFLALSHMKKCQILHADLKPDNILVSERRNLLKICDLGTAAFAEDAEVTPYLVSRFYRAPEVVLGMPFDYAIDMWAIGCTLFELYTGRILFAGADNNQMLRAIQECRGKFPIRMLKKSTLAEKHFDMDGTFFSQERNKLTGKTTMRQLNFNKTAPGKDLRSRLSGNTKGMKPEEIKEHAAFVDLMDKCLQLDPARRISPNEALRHGFIVHAAMQPLPPTEKAVPAVKLAMNVPRMR